MKMTVASSLLSPFACSLVTCCGLLLCVLCSAIHPSSRQLPWIRLTSDNFSSEIHTYPFVLCLATVPWSGESRSLMTDLSETLGVNENLHISTQLRVVYINQDKCLDKFFLQSKRYLAFTFFWYSTPFRYKGKLRAQNILTAINHAVSLKSSDYPFKRLETKSDLDRFRESTDRAVILFDFCNYSDRIKDRHHSKKDKSIQLFARSRKAKDVEGVKRLVGLEEELLYEGSPCLTSNVECAIVSPGKQDFEVDAKSGTMDSRMCHRPLLEDLIKNVIRPEGDSISYSPQNNGDEQTISCESEPEFGLGYSQSLLFQTSSSGWEISQKISSPKNVKSVIFGQLDSCNNTEYTHFVSIHRNLVKFVKTYILTPEQVDFAIVENKSLLPALGIDVMQNHTWFLMQWIPDWPDLPLLYDEHEELHSFLFHPKKLVNELVLESIRNPSSLLNDTSSVVLFIDRVSPVMDVRKKSWEALKALRAFARGYFNQENLELHLNAYPEVKGEPYLANKGLSSFVHSIFESRVPKEDVNSQESTSYAYTVSHLTDKSTRISENGPTDFGHNVVMKILVEGQKNLQLDASLLKEDLQSLDIGSILLTEDDFVSRKIEEKKNQKIDTQSPLSKVESLFSSNIGSFIEFHPAKMSPELKEDHQEVDEKVNMQSDNHNSFSFYFADGEDQWKEVIEPSLPYPSIVILDFLQEEKFVFSAPNRSIDYTSLKGFFERYADNQLQKTYLSEVAPNKPRKRVQPPFVNRDFHETDGVPRITTERLLRLLGYSVGRHRDVSSFDSTEDMGQLCKKSALVLYTAPACGFCKRMELVFREVHRMITLYLDGSGDSSFMQEVEHTYSTFDMGDKDMNIGGNLKGIDQVRLKEQLPQLFQLDCTLNDCSVFFKSIEQEVLYPSLILYPVEAKDHPIIFGDLATVHAILKFIAIEGQVGMSGLDFLQGISRRKRSNRTIHSQRKQCIVSEPSRSVFIDSTSSDSRNAYYFTTDTARESSTRSQHESSSLQNGISVKPIVYPTVGSVLLATDKLSRASKAFENTKIMIVKADAQEGFQGLIFNKPLDWSRLSGLDSETEPLVNKTVLCYGGPVIYHGEPLLSLSRLNNVDGFTEVIPGVHVGSPSATMYVFRLIKEGRLEAADFWFFVGHAVWGWQQLISEIEQQWWNLTSYEEGSAQLPIPEWLEGSIISVANLTDRI